MILASGQGGIWWNKSFLHAFFLFHPSILKPNLDLGFIELKSAGNFNSSGSGQVLVEMELLFQLGQLLGGEVGPAGVVDSSGTPAQASATAGTVTPGVHPVTSVTRGTRLGN